jgi:hypothetical protein
MRMTDTMPKLAPTGPLNLVHRSAILREPLARIPEYAETLEQMRRLDAAALPMPDTSDVVKTAADVVLDLLASGGDVPSDLPARVAQIKASSHARADSLRAVDRVRAELTARLDTALSTNVGSLYRHLDAQLQHLLREVRELRDLSELATAESALLHDRRADWQKLGDLTSAYLDVRKAQGLLLRHVTRHTPRYPEHLALPDLLGTFPDYFTWKSTGYREDPETMQRTYLEPPWPLEAGPARHPSRAADLLLWAAESGGRLWVPTMTQLRAADDEVHAAAESDAQPLRRLRRTRITR